MLRLTLRTLLAYLDDTLDPASSRLIGQKVAENATAQELVDRIKKVTRKRGLSTPPSGGERSPSDPNNVSGYLSDSLTGEQIAQFEMACLESDVLLAEVAACHQVLTLVLSEPMKVPPPARRRMYALVKGRESIPNRRVSTITPVGGVVREDNQTDAGDDADDPILLGMPAYSQSSSPTRRLLTAGAAAACLLGLGIAVWMALPSTEKPPADDGVAVVKPAPVVPVPPTKPKEPEKPKEKEKEPEKPKEKEPEKPKEKEKEPEKPKDPEKIEPPKRKDPVELAPVPQPPKGDKAIIGKLDRAQPVVLRQPAGEEAWTRVTAADSNLVTTDRYLALPGYKATLKLDSETHVELWGNLPEFLPAPLFASSVTVHAPYPGFAADLTVQTGRIYLNSKLAEGAKVRLRFGDEIWDVTIPDDKTEVAFELRQTLPRGNLPEPVQTTALLGVPSGTKAGVKVRYKDYVVNKDEFLAWDSKGKGVEGPKKADGKAGPKASYFARVQPTADTAPAKAATTALDDLSKKLTDAKRFRAVFAEALQERPEPPTTTVVAAARIAVLDQATLGDVPGVVEALNEPNRPYIREAAVVGLPYCLATNPAAAQDVRAVFADKARLSDAQTTTALKLLAGLTEQDRTSPAALDAVVDALAANAVCLRELAFYTLLSDVDPEARGITALTRFDAGAPDAARDPAVKAWKKRVEDLKKKLPGDK